MYLGARTPQGINSRTKFGYSYIYLREDNTGFNYDYAIQKLSISIVNISNNKKMQIANLVHVPISGMPYPVRSNSKY